MLNSCHGYIKLPRYLNQSFVYAESTLKNAKLHFSNREPDWIESSFGIAQVHIMINMSKVMRYSVLVLILISTSLAHAAKYKQIGHMEKHPDSEPKNSLGGIQNLFYSGDKICMPASEGHSPDCRKPEAWIITDIGSTTITLEDGTSFEVESNGHAHRNVFDRVVDKWVTDRLTHNALGPNYNPDADAAAAQGTFRYRLHKVNSVMYEIEIKGVGKGPYPNSAK
jgi:hypothetical protein